MNDIACAESSLKAVPPELDMNRVGNFWLEEELLIAVLKGEFVIDGWPEDATVLAVAPSFERRAICIKVWSASFQPVMPGARPPTLGNFHQIGSRVERIEGADGRKRFVLVSENAERIDLPDGRVRFREFL